MTQEKISLAKAEDPACSKKKNGTQPARPVGKQGAGPIICRILLCIMCLCPILIFHAVRSGKFDHLIFQYRDGRKAAAERIQDSPDERRSAAELLAKGKKLAIGDSVESVQAVGYYRKAAELGNVEAQFLLAKWYDKGEGVPQNREKALFWYHKAVEKSSSFSMESQKAKFILGRAYETGDGVAQDKAQALEWYHKAAQGSLSALAGEGKPEAAFALWRLYDAGDGVPQDKEKALYWLRKAADLRNCDAEFRLGGMYETGDGVSRDKKRALELYKESASSYCETSDDAMFALWRMYDAGDGVPRDKEKALDWLRKAADRNNVAAAYTLGMMYYRGDGLDKDIHKAAPLLQRAAEKGDEKALDAMRQDDLRKALEENLKAEQDARREELLRLADASARSGGYQLAEAYAEGAFGLPRDKDMSLFWYIWAAKAGDSKAMLTLWRKYDTGDGVPQDKEKALEWLLLAGKEFDAKALLLLGRLTEQGCSLLPQSRTLAAELYSNAAKRGNSEAMFLLASMMEAGDIVPQNKKEALALYHKAGHGCPLAAYRLSRLYSRGEGVESDQDVAAFLFEQARKRIPGPEDAAGQLALGQAYAEGKDVPRDKHLAAFWLCRAAEQGNAEAQFALGALYADRSAAPFDKKQVYEWFSKAAAQDNAEAQWRLGLLYDTGDGIPQNKVKAAEWYGKAAKRGNENARTALQREDIRKALEEDGKAP